MVKKMIVKRKVKTFEAVQWTGNNKAKCDALAGEKSVRDKKRLIYQNIMGVRSPDDSGIEIHESQWLFKNGETVSVISDDQFNRKFEAA